MCAEYYPSMPYRLHSIYVGRWQCTETTFNSLFLGCFPADMLETDRCEYYSIGHDRAILLKSNTVLCNRCLHKNYKLVAIILSTTCEFWLKLSQWFCLRIREKYWHLYPRCLRFRGEGNPKQIGKMCPVHYFSIYYNSD